MATTPSVDSIGSGLEPQISNWQNDREGRLRKKAVGIVAAGSAQETQKLRNLGQGFLVGGWLIAVLNVIGGIAVGQVFIGVFGGWVSVSIGFAIRGLFGALASIDDNIRDVAENLASRYPEVHAETSASEDPPVEFFEGSAVSEIVLHLRGVQWGKTATGQTVYKEQGGESWVLYERHVTPWIPPFRIRRDR